MKQFLALLTVLCGTLAGQSIIAPASTVNGVPATNLITICKVNPGSGTCSGGNLVTTYTTIAISTACSGTGGPLSGTGCTNPGNSDSAGNIVAFAAAGQYWCQYKQNPVAIAYSLPCTATGGGTGGVSSPLVLGNPPANVTASNGKCAGQGLGPPFLEVYDPNQSTTQLIELLCSSGSAAISINLTDFGGFSGMTLSPVGNPGSGWFIIANTAFPNQFLEFLPLTSTGAITNNDGIFFQNEATTSDPTFFFRDRNGKFTLQFAVGTTTCGALVQSNLGVCVQAINGSGNPALANLYISSLHAGITSTGALPIDGSVESKQLNQLVTKNFAGTCTMSAGTTCTFSLTQGYTSTPLCFASVQSAAPTTFQGSCALSGTTVTITASAANSNIWAALLIGNPN